MTAAAAPATTPSITWSVDPSHTSVEFSAKHMMITTVKGRFTDVTATINAPGDDPTHATVVATLKAASLDTRTEQRDTHLRSADFLDVEKYPDITFRSTRIERTGTDGLRMTGDLTIRDTTREIAFDVVSEGMARDPWGGERAGFTATTKIDRRDFKLTWNVALEAGGILVGNDIKISLDVQAVRQAPTAK